MNKKIKNLGFIALASIFTLSGLTGCTTPKPVVPTDPTTVIEDEKYVIQVTAPSAVTWELSKKEAKKDEDVTLTIKELAPGAKIKSITLNSKEIIGEADGKTYNFKMPNRSVSIVITVSIEGDVVIEGDIAASLQEIGTTGVYVARGVKANGSKSQALFNWVIRSGASSKKCQALDLDETRSFADIQMTTGNKDYTFGIANGYTYDFYYDSNDAEAPCYVQRVGVDVMPTNVAQLQRLLIVNNTVRSEYAIYPENFVGAHYEINDRSTDDVIENTYDWDLYENNLSFGKVTSTSGFDDDETMYVYKKYDEATKRYTFVDTYPLKSGNKTINDDRYRMNNNNFGAIAGTLNVIEGDDYGHAYSLNEKKAVRNVRNTAHMPNFFLERDIMYSYRVGFQTDDGMSYSLINITPTEKDYGFDVKLDSTKEFDTASTGTIGLERRLEAYKYTASFKFTNKGELLNLEYKEVYFASDVWDFVNHTPKTSTTKGKTLKTIKASYTYGDKKTGTPDYGDFNLSDYFITGFNNLQLFNNKIQDSEAKEAGKSIVAINDTVTLFDSYAKDFSPLITNKKYYAPETALDYWQYAPVASSDESVIKHTNSNAAYEMTAINTGTTKLTIDSHVEGFGLTVELDVEVRAASLAREFYMNGNTSPDQVYTAQSAYMKAGGVYHYALGVTPSDAAMKYEAVSSNESLLKITSAPNSFMLEVDVRGAADIEDTKVVTVTMNALYQFKDKAETQRMDPTEFTFYILPADINPIGKWKVNDAAYPNTYALFTDEAYTGPVAHGMEGALKGSIHDDVYDGQNQLVSSDNYYFYYTYDSGNLKVQLYEIDLQEPEGLSLNPTTWELDFVYDAPSGRYLVWLANVDEFDPETYTTYYNVVVLGNLVEGSDEKGYTPLTKVA